MPGLISDALLNNLRNVAYRQLVTDVTIERVTFSAGAADTSRSWSEVESTTGWLVEERHAYPGEDVGHRDTATQSYELRLRQGTDILPGDRCLIGGSYYTVGDVNSEVTISLFLKATLRRVE